jgi:uncharacterized membrane protein YhaH (DUF805 family)
MDNLKRTAFAYANLFLLSGTAFAQGPGESSPEAGCAACATCGGIMIIVPLTLFALGIAMLVWVARDAKARGMDSAVIWMILVMVTSVIGLIIYLFSRPQGNLIQCPNCGNKRLQASAKCPHCGNA